MDIKTKKQIEEMGIDKAAAIAALDPILKQFGTICAESTLDGRRVEYADGWVNIRQSNTEPYLRLIAEATTPELLASRLDRMRAILTPFTL
jgi:phosphomannomutase